MNYESFGRIRYEINSRMATEVSRKRKVSAEYPESLPTPEEEGDVIGPLPALPSEAAEKKRKG